MMQIVGEEDPTAISCYKTGANKNMELNILPGVYHTFGSVVACGKRDSAENLMIYDSSAVTKARELTKVFLAKHLGM